MSLIEETKKAISYQNKANTCADCEHCQEIENPHVDRSWINVCTVSGVCNFEVSLKGTCMRFKAAP